MANTSTKKSLFESLLMALAVTTPVFLIGLVVGLIVAVFRSATTGIF